MKRFAILLLALLLLVGCYSDPAVVKLGGMPVRYDSTEKMEAAATLVVTGKVLSCDTRINQLGGQVSSALTLSQFEITDVKKGDVQPGEIITVWQDSAYDKENHTVYLFAEAIPLEEEEIYTLYLRPREAGSEFYVLISYQGIVPANSQK